MVQVKNHIVINCFGTEMACMETPMSNASIYTENEVMIKQLTAFSNIDEIVEVRATFACNSKKTWFKNNH